MSQYYKIKNSTLPLLFDDMEICAKVIYEHKDKFDEYVRNNSKLAAVKSLKDYTGFSLRESKLFIDLYYNGDIEILSVKENRKQKLERLAKKPLVEELVKKLKNINEEELNILLMSLSIDELFSIEEKFDDN